ncbi:hypothetical protein ASPCAL11693 [Aspergillus calidoustus]|uniref:Uncharacterized protein n=1 Tax=Aspergillus calidoustus TaxID=454130 RepID=A0A0U5G9W1_ASPCI|nr:hypothetical protein ASPCAL11693 [Aspergillus calidoustus]
MSSSTSSITVSHPTPTVDHVTIYIASIQATFEAPITAWKIILAPPTNEDCIFCDITLLDGNKYAPLTIRRGETLRVPFLIKGKIVHLNKVCTAPVAKARMVIDEAHFATHGSQVWTVSFLTMLEDERIVPQGTVGYYENLAAVEGAMEDFKISTGG